MIDGRPETLFDAADDCAALVAAWYPGEEGSAALAKLLFGEKNFSAKLPVTFPRHTGQLPIYHDRTPSECGYYHKPGTPDAPGRDYVFSSTEPAFAFGHGIGYSAIRYRALTATRAESGIDVTVQIENCGNFDAEEAVLVFLRDEVASIPQPMKKLAAMEKIALAAGETKKVTLHIPEDALAFTDIFMQKKIESGYFTVTVGELSARIFIA